MVTGPPGRPRDERASQAINEAALRQLDDVGYANITMESVAAEAGVARATVYRRYHDKADLVTAAIAASSGDEGSAASRPSTDPRRDLVKMLIAFDRRFAEACLEVVGGLLGAREEPHAMELHRRRVVAPRLGEARALLMQARQLGELDPDADLDLAVQMLLGVVLARRLSGIPSDRSWATRAVDAIWRGMGSCRREEEGG